MLLHLTSTKIQVLILPRVSSRICQRQTKILGSLLVVEQSEIKKIMQSPPNGHRTRLWHCHLPIFFSNLNFGSSLDHDILVPPCTVISLLHSFDNI